MSHRDLDHAASLAGLIAAADAQLAEMKGADVVDMRAVADLKRHRDGLAAELERNEARAR